MSLSQRLKSAQPNRSNKLCATCEWWKKIRPETRRLIQEWLDDPTRSRTQLHEIISSPGDDVDEPVLEVSVSAWRLHLKHHEERCR